MLLFLEKKGGASWLPSTCIVSAAVEVMIDRNRLWDELTQSINQ